MNYVDKSVYSRDEVRTRSRIALSTPCGRPARAETKVSQVAIGTFKLSFRASDLRSERRLLACMRDNVQRGETKNQHSIRTQTMKLHHTAPHSPSPPPMTCDGRSRCTQASLL